MEPPPMLTAPGADHPTGIGRGQLLVPTESSYAPQRVEDRVGIWRLVESGHSYLTSGYDIVLTEGDREHGGGDLTALDQ